MAGVQAGRLSIEIVAEIARLQTDLDKAKRAVRDASKDMGVSAAAANDNIAKMGRGLGEVNTTSRAMRASLINLGRQVQDVGTMFALGAPPMQIFASQGAQIVDVLVMLKAQAEEADTSLTGMTVRGLRAAAPYAAAVAALAGAFAVLANEVNKNAEVHVSWKNIALGALDTVAEYASKEVTGAFDAMGIDVGEVWNNVVKYSKTALNLMIGATTLTQRMIVTAWKTLPGAIADVFYSAVNMSIRAINSLVEKTVAAINGFASLVNPILEKVGLSLPKLLAPKIGEVENAYAGAARAAGQAFVNTYTDTVNTDFVGVAADAIRGNAVKRQLAENAAEAGKGAGKAMGQAAGEEYPKAFLEALARQEKLVDMNMDRLAKGYEDQARATDELRTKQADLRNEFRALIDARTIELNLIEASQQERRTAALYLEREGFMARYAALGIEQATLMWEEYLAVNRAIIDGESAADVEARRLDNLSRSLEGLAGMIGGGFGRGLSDILSIEVELKDGTVERLSETISRAIEGTFPGLSNAIGAAFQGAQIGSGISSIIGSTGIRTSQTGGAVGGAAGGALGMAIGGPVGAKIGQIAGSILGSIVGGMLKGTPRASVTVSGIGGEAMQTAIQGNSGKLKDIATGMANSLIGGLASIAEQFGGQVGNFSGISIGTRNGTFRVDPTGQGRTKNLPQFTTEEEAIREALRIAISRGAITGIRAGTDALLRGVGDLETQISKALAFEGVFTRLAQETDPLGFALGNLEKEFTALRAIFAEAGATTAELAQLEQLYGIERNKVMEQFKAEVDETGQVIGAANELLRERRSLEARLLELQGDAAGALAIARELELAALDATLRPLMQQIYALEDAAVAADEAARAQEDAAAATRALAEEAARLAEQRAGLEVDLLRALGRETEALAMERQQELAALPETLRGLKSQIFAAQDATAAANAAAAAQAEAARIQQEAAQEAARIAGERFGLETRLLELQGNTAALRERELAGLDATNRALLEQIFALEDTARAAQAIADQMAAAVSASANAAEQAAQEARRIADERIGLEDRLLAAQGQTAEIRRRELEALNPVNRSLLERLFLLEDERARVEAATQAAQEAAARIAAIAEQRSSLEVRYLEAIGDSAGALALRRAEELAATDETNRALLQMIFAAEDAASAVGGVTNSLDTLREAAALQVRLLEAQGREEEALALRREQELAATAEGNRALLEQIFAAEDAARARAEAERLGEEAARRAAEAQESLARAQEEAARAAEEAARILAEIARERTDLTIRLYELEGRNAEATALRRQLELEATDVSNRALLQQIFALEDAAAVQAEYAEAVERQTAAVAEARNALSGAYEREAGVLRNTADQFREFGASLREFRAGLFAADAGTAASYRQLQVDFLRTSALAATGDTAALGQLQGAGSAFLEASMSQASTEAQYLRDVAFVARAVDDAIAATDDAVDYAQEQLAALEQLVSGYIELNENVLTVAQAIRDLEAAMAGQAVPVPVIPASTAAQQMAAQSEAVAASSADMRAEIAALRDDFNAQMTAVARNTRETSDVLKRADGGDFVRIGNDRDTPVFTDELP